MKRSKKRWDWTPNNLRSSRNTDSHWYSPPKDFRRIYNKSLKAYFKNELYKEVVGVEEIVYPLRTWRSSAKWEWV